MEDDDLVEGPGSQGDCKSKLVNNFAQVCFYKVNFNQFSGGYALNGENALA